MLNLIGRKIRLFDQDILSSTDLYDIVSKSKFLVIGGAGSIGQAVTKEIFANNPLKLHVVDISENNLVELVRDLRSSFGYIDGDFKTFALDIGSIEYDSFIDCDGKYDYVLNLSALKHVRSERDPYTLMRMINVNIFNTEKTIKQSIKKGVKKYFCVSTDKAANPVNMMGASKRIMEMYLMKYSKTISISTARFANVAFSDGSLLHGINQRIKKVQPIAAPTDIKRYFILPEEAGQLCLMSCLYAENRDIFFPKLNKDLHLMSFADIVSNYLSSLNYKTYLCDSEDEARHKIKSLIDQRVWPCLFKKSDTSGEKDAEEFYTENEVLDLQTYSGIGVIKNKYSDNLRKIEFFDYSINNLIANKKWDKASILKLFNEMIPNFNHIEKGKYLDSKM